MDYPSFNTLHLLLRPFRLSDAARVQLLAGDELIAATTLNIPHPYPDGLAKEWISTHEDDFIQKKSLILAICLQEDEKLIGAVGLTLNAIHQHAELGYWIGSPYWNHGYCTEACAALMSFGFEHLNLNRIFAQYFLGNDASVKVMQKLGMKYEGHLRQHVKHGQRFVDLIVYGILKEDFFTGRKNGQDSVNNLQRL